MAIQLRFMDEQKKGQNTSEGMEVMFMDRVAFEKEGGDIGESGKVQNIMHIKAKRRIGHNI